MEIEIRLYHGLNKYLPPGEGEYSRRIKVPPGASVKDVLVGLGISATEGLLVFVGGVNVPCNHCLKHDDVLTVLRPAVGG